MAYTRGYYDLADTPGFRIVYLALIEAFANAGASIAAFCLAGLMIFGGAVGGLSIFFVCMAFVGLLLMTPRFPIYQR